jgi:hypothetical protein
MRIISSPGDMPVMDNLVPVLFLLVLTLFGEVCKLTYR